MDKVKDLGAELARLQAISTGESPMDPGTYPLAESFSKEKITPDPEVKKEEPKVVDAVVEPTPKVDETKVEETPPEDSTPSVLDALRTESKEIEKQDDEERNEYERHMQRMSNQLAEANRRMKQMQYEQDVQSGKIQLTPEEQIRYQVKIEAQQIAEASEWNTNLDHINADGLKNFKDFGKATQDLANYLGNDRDSLVAFLKPVMKVVPKNEQAELIRHLSKKLWLANEYISMDPMQQGAYLVTQLAEMNKAKVAAKISKAPPPIETKVNGASPATTDSDPWKSGDSDSKYWAEVKKKQNDAIAARQKQMQGR